ncbi:MAG: nucleotidyltransferase domain-containing protein [Syntrophus sp. (in: bacteria)]
MTDAVKLSLVYANILRARMGAPLKKVFLYGSQARGDANEGSDYDVFVLVDRRTSEIRETVIDAGVEMMNRYDKLFAAIIYGEEEWRKAQGSPLLWNIQQEGIEL